MADQKSRGGQKQSAEKQPGGKRNREVHPHKSEPDRDMAEDARRGRQANQGGYASIGPDDEDEDEDEDEEDVDEDEEEDDDLEDIDPSAPVGDYTRELQAEFEDQEDEGKLGA
jgi:hypothetical protein